MKYALVCGAGGFIGTHLVTRLKKDGYFVVGADLKTPEFSNTDADIFELVDLRRTKFCEMLLEKKYWMDHPYDEVYQLAADMGGAGFVFTGEHDADIMHNSALINLNVAKGCIRHNVKKLFYSSSACVYPKENQTDPDDPNCIECSAYPANPDSEYGWEKIFSERLYLSFLKNYRLNVRIARFHNIFGPLGSWDDGREKAPAALCRKVAEAKDGTSINVWGDGKQTRSFLYIDECIDGIVKLMGSNYKNPINIGSEEMVSINSLAKLIINISGKSLAIKNVDGPEGVRGRTSDNTTIQKVLGWKPTQPLISGLKKLYTWIDQQINS